MCRKRAKHRGELQEPQQGGTANRTAERSCNCSSTPAAVMWALAWQSHTAMGVWDGPPPPPIAPPNQRHTNIGDATLAHVQSGSLYQFILR